MSTYVLVGERVHGPRPLPDSSASRGRRTRALGLRLGSPAAAPRPADGGMLALRPLPVPVETTEEGADYPPIVDSPPGLPGRKNLLPLSSTAELFREFQHFGLRTLKSSHRAGARPTKPTITLPQGCTIIAQDRIVVDRQLAQ